MPKRRYFDPRYTFFGIAFPWAVAFCFAAMSLVLRTAVPERLGLHWNDGHADVTASFLAFVVLFATAIGVGGSVAGALGGARLSRRWLRRVLMGTAVGLSLLGAAAGAAWLIGHQGASNADEGRFDAVVFALGSGGATALGVIVAFVYQPQQLWGAADDKALTEAAAAYAGRPTVRFWVHSRASSFVFLCLLGIFPAGLLLALSSWLSLFPLLLALVLAGGLFAQVRIDGGQVCPARLRVFVAGFLSLADCRLNDLKQVEVVTVRVWSMGGPGPRRRGAKLQYVCRDGAAVRLTDGQVELLLGVPAAVPAQQLARYLRHRALSDRQSGDAGAQPS